MSINRHIQIQRIQGDNMSFANLKQSRGNFDKLTKELEKVTLQQQIKIHQVTIDSGIRTR